MFGYVNYLELFQILFVQKQNRFTQMDSSYKKMKDQLLSDTIPISDRDSNEPVMRKRSLTRPRVRTMNHINY
jgi:hypothetical protein